MFEQCCWIHHPGRVSHCAAFFAWMEEHSGIRDRRYTMAAGAGCALLRTEIDLHYHEDDAMKIACGRRMLVFQEIYEGERAASRARNRLAQAHAGLSEEDFCSVKDKYPQFLLEPLRPNPLPEYQQENKGKLIKLAINGISDTIRKRLNLAGLTADQHETVLLVGGLGMKGREAAGVLGRSESAVEVSLKLAREKFKKFAKQARKTHGPQGLHTQMARSRNIHTPADVADALGIPRPVPASWVQHGYLPFFDDRRLGRDDIAFAAAFAAVAALIGAAHAAQVMRQVVNDQPRYWTKALEVAISRKAKVYILIRRYDYNGLGQLEAALRIGADLQRELAIFGDPTQKGERVRDWSNVGDAIAREEHEIHQAHELPKTAALPVGEHIAAALRVLRVS